MARFHERSLPTGQGRLARFAWVLEALPILGCAGNRTTPDAGSAVSDALSSEYEASKAIAPNLDARIGLGGGAACDASEECLSGGCALGICSDWAHVMKIGIDTTSAGAAVGGDIPGFPLLVRLNGVNFPFDDARYDGADIRFLDQGGNTLAHEIERWDADEAVAEIWVLVPRITGNSRNNLILMYWGNRLSTPTSSGSSVFRSFSCAFHMGRAPNGNALQIDDISGHGNDAVAQGQSTAALHGDGLAGCGLTLDGSTLLTTSHRLPAPQTMALSLWLKTSTSTGGGIAGFASNSSGDSVRHDRAVAMDPSGRLSFSVLRGGALATLTSPASYNDGKWHFIVARFSSSGQYLFVDGTSLASDPTLTSADAYSGYWRFGEQPAQSPPEDSPDAAASVGSYIAGTLDEVRFSTDEPSDDWIKLCYATQRPNATAVVYPPLP